jgi:phenylalanyl-tRNA synthetase beta chain
VKVFEIGKIYAKQEKSPSSTGILPVHTKEITGKMPVLLGMQDGNSEIWYLGGILFAKDADYSEGKRALENLFETLKINGMTFCKMDPVGANGRSLLQMADFHPGKTALIKNGDQVVGLVGELHPRVQESYKWPHAPIAFLLDLDQLKSACSNQTRYTSISKFPSTTQDIAFMVPKTVSHAEIVATIQASSNTLVESVQLFDRYEGEPVPAGWVSMAYSITYRDPEKTLVEKDVMAVHEKIAGAVKEKLGATFR